MANNNGSGKSLESWIWDAACSIRGAKDAPKYKGYILPLIFTKRLGLEDVKPDYDNDELDRFPAGAGFPGKSSADWGWVQHMHASRIPFRRSAAATIFRMFSVRRSACGRSASRPVLP